MEVATMRDEQNRTMAMERARRQAEYLDRAVAAEQRAQAQREYLARSQALARELRRRQVEGTTAFRSAVPPPPPFGGIAPTPPASGADPPEPIIGSRT